MRTGLVAIFLFAALLALGHYVAAPMYCRGAFSLPTLDPRLLCGADMHLSRSGSVLLYFTSIALAFFFGAVAGLVPGRAAPPAKAAGETKPAETPEDSVAAKEEAAAMPPAATPAMAVSAVAASAAETPATETPAAGISSAAPSPDAAPDIPSTSAASALSETAAEPPAPSATAQPEESAPAAEAATPVPESVSESPQPPAGAGAGAESKPEPAAAAADPLADPAALTFDEVIAASKSDERKGFEGTNQELVERFRELKKLEGVNSIAQAQRLLDESMLNALARGTDPKQHLSEIAHLVLADDPDLKSRVMRGVVVHIAARLKELGVVQKIHNPAQPAA